MLSTAPLARPASNLYYRICVAETANVKAKCLHTSLELQLDRQFSAAGQQNTRDSSPYTAVLLQGAFMSSARSTDVISASQSDARTAYLCPLHTRIKIYVARLIFHLTHRYSMEACASNLIIVLGASLCDFRGCICHANLL